MFANVFTKTTRDRQIGPPGGGGGHRRPALVRDGGLSHGGRVFL